MPFGPNAINTGYGQSQNNPTGISNEVIPQNPAQTPGNFVITGGSIDGTPIGITTPAAGKFTTIDLSTPLSVANGGTGQSSTPSNGQLLIGNGSGFSLNTLVAGSGIQITNSSGNITLQTTGGSGTVTYVDVSGGTTGLTFNGGPVTTSGTISMAGILAIANGGTGAASESQARTNLGVTATGTDTTYLYRANNLSDLGSSVTARNNLGLGTIATQNANNVAITGGAINGTPIGSSTTSTGAFTTLSATGNILSSGGIVGYSSGTTVYTIGSGGYNGPVGGSTPAAGAFTTLTASTSALIGSASSVPGRLVIHHNDTNASLAISDNADVRRVRFDSTYGLIFSNSSAVDTASISNAGAASFTTLAASGVLSFTGASAFPGALGSDGIAKGYASSTNGLVLYGRGSTNDFLIADRNGNEVIKCIASGNTVLNSANNNVAIQIASSTIATVSSTGLVVTGGGTFTGNANSAGHVVAQLQNANGNSGIGARLAWRLDNLANEWGYINVNRVGAGATAQMDFAVNGAAYTGAPSVVASLTSTGLAVTGSLAVTGQITSGIADANCFLTTSTGYGATTRGYAVSNSAGNDVTYFGMAGSSASGVIPANEAVIYSQTALNVRIGASVITRTSSTGLAVTGALSATGPVLGSNLAFNGNQLVEYATNATTNIAINYGGYALGGSQFRDLNIYDGKGALVAAFVGSTKALTTSGNVIISAGNDLQLYNTSGNAYWQIYNSAGSGAANATFRYSGVNYMTVSNAGIAVTGEISGTMSDAQVGARIKSGTGRLRLMGYYNATLGAIIDAVNTAENDYVPLSLNASTTNILSYGTTIGQFGSTGLAVTGTLSTTGSVMANAGTGIDVSNNSSVGVELRNDNILLVARESNTAGAFARRSSNGELLAFWRSTTQVGSISVTTTTTAYNTSSDARLKTNIRDLTDSGAILDLLKPRIFDWKTGQKDSIGFVAQELHEVYPQAVSKGDDGEEITQQWGVDFSKLVPVLVAELKTLRARVAKLEAKE